MKKFLYLTFTLLACTPNITMTMLNETRQLQNKLTSKNKEINTLINAYRKLQQDRNTDRENNTIYGLRRVIAEKNKEAYQLNQKNEESQETIDECYDKINKFKRYNKELHTENYRCRHAYNDLRDRHEALDKEKAQLDSKLELLSLCCCATNVFVGYATYWYTLQPHEKTA